MYIYIHKYVCAYTYLRIRAKTDLNRLLALSALVKKVIYIYIYIYVYIRIYMYIYIFTYTYIYTYIYLHVHIQNFRLQPRPYSIASSPSAHGGQIHLCVAMLRILAGALQCVAEFCSVLQCIAVCCSMLRLVAVCCSV